MPRVPRRLPASPNGARRKRKRRRGGRRHRRRTAGGSGGHHASVSEALWPPASAGRGAGRPGRSGSTGGGGRASRDALMRVSVERFSHQRMARRDAAGAHRRRLPHRVVRLLAQTESRQARRARPSIKTPRGRSIRADSLVHPHAFDYLRFSGVRRQFADANAAFEVAPASAYDG